MAEYIGREAITEYLKWEFADGFCSFGERRDDNADR